MVLPTVLVYPLDRSDVPWFGDDTNRGLITASVTADSAERILGDVLAPLAKPELDLGVLDRIRQPVRLVIGNP